MKPRRFAPRQEKTAARLHRADTCVAKYRHGFARARRLTRQLCTRSTPLPRSANGGGALSLRSDGRKLVRQSEQLVRPRKAKMAARLRPARTSNSPRCFARARHRNRPRGSARPRLSALTVSTAIFRTLLSAGAPFRRPKKWPTSLIKPNWSETPSLDSAACCLGLPWSPEIRPSFRYVPSAGTQIHWLRAVATGPGTSPQTRRTWHTSASRLRCHAGVLPGQNTRAVIFKAAPFAVSRWRVTLGKRVPAVSRVSLRADGPVH